MNAVSVTKSNKGVGFAKSISGSLSIIVRGDHVRPPSSLRFIAKSIWPGDPGSPGPRRPSTNANSTPSPVRIIPGMR